MKAAWQFVFKRLCMVGLGLLIGIVGAWSPDRTLEGLIGGMRKNGLI